MGRWGDGNPPAGPPRSGMWGDGEMGRWGVGKKPKYILFLLIGAEVITADIIR
ncbi:hypothetical protein [Okeania sp. SIO1I7]|uniref:hypothetical protein n=1 Tax=Okeania sp. SIO1I7 TaxID=2607772 RepID=UPI00260014A1|nr:hypothetical protein [Okeania sp. SIO1I7]